MCLFCIINTKGMCFKTTNSVIYPDVATAMKPVVHKLPCPTALYAETGITGYSNQ